jgi:thioredoxin-dependent peroxiredoxin
MSETPRIGAKVADFSAATSAGPFRLKDAAGEALVLYFYPRDNTTGCTREGSEFAAQHAAFRRTRTRILGVSPDSVASHEKFKAKYRFPFELISDGELSLCRQFDVYKEKSMYGKRYMGVERSTFLIDAKGVLRGEWRKVKVAGHVDEVLAAVRSL